MNEVTKSQILADRFAFTKDEMVKINALELCQELIQAEKTKRDYKILLANFERLKEKYLRAVIDEPKYTTINLRH